MRRINEDNTVQTEALALRVDGAGAGLEAVSAAQRALDESFALLEASARVLKRELHRRRWAPVVSADPDPDRSAGPEAAAPVVPPLAQDGAAEDDGSAYVGFEDVFRGRHDDIVERQRSYLPYFESATDVLDLGCGRGEFLELLRERGHRRPRHRHQRGDGRSLRRTGACRHPVRWAQPPAGVAGCVGRRDCSRLRWVEHLGPRYLMRLLEAMHRVLCPGGRAVVETINPASWTAFFSAYLRDVTHRQPLHPDTLQHLLRAAGFVAVEVVYRSPPPEDQSVAAHSGRPDPVRHTDGPPPSASWPGPSTGTSTG